MLMFEERMKEIDRRLSEVEKVLEGIVLPVFEKE